MLKKYLFPLFSIFLFNIIVVNLLKAQDASINEKIVLLLEKSGGQANFDAALDQMFEYQKELYKEDTLVIETLETFYSEFKKEGIDELNKIMIPIYKKYYTEEELDAAINYFTSKEGQSTVEKMPAMLKESMRAGMEWGQSIGKSLEEVIKNEKKQLKNDE